MVQKRFHRFFTQNKIPTLIICGLILLAVGIAIMLIFRVYSKVTFYFGFPAIIIGAVMSMVSYSYRVKGTELDDHLNSVSEQTFRDFDSLFKLGRTESEVVRYPVSGWLFSGEDITARRVGDGKARSQYFYNGVVSLTSGRLNILSRSYSLYEENALTEDKYSVAYTNLKAAEFEVESFVYPYTGTVTQQYLKVYLIDGTDFKVPVLENAIIDTMLDKIKGRAARATGETDE